MPITCALYADASSRAVQAFGGLSELAGKRYLFPRKTPGILTPPMGLIAVASVERLCLDLAGTSGAPESQLHFDVEAPVHEGLPSTVWDPLPADGIPTPHVQPSLYPVPSLRALGVLRQLAHQTAARIWLRCDHERGDDPYDQWAWLLAPARSGTAAYEMVFAYGGDAGRVLWRRDWIGPDPWRVLDEEPGTSPVGRLIQQLELHGHGTLPSVCIAPDRYRAFSFDPGQPSHRPHS